MDYLENEEENRFRFPEESEPPVIDLDDVDLAENAVQQENLHESDTYGTYRTYVYPQSEEESAPESRSRDKKRKMKKRMRLMRTLMYGALVLLLVIVGCNISVQRCNRYWQQQFDLMSRNLLEKHYALQQQLDAYKDAGSGAGSLENGEGNLTAAEIYAQNADSVVAITCVTRKEVYGEVINSTSSGTGFIITEDGYIVTNHHVIDGATKITITMADGSQHLVKLIGSNDTNDIAVLKANLSGLNPVTLGSSSAMQVGDQVVAIGNALGELSSTLTVGYISGINRNVSTDGTVINMLQADAAINSGNSGGPLFNARGEVIGITTAKYSGTTSSGASIEGISFAIPLDDVLDMIEDLRDYGFIRSAYLGVLVWEVDAKVAETYNLPLGVYVEEVTPGFCADKAGVQAKDIIVELGGYSVKTMNDLSRALRAYEGGTTVTIVVWRAGQQLILSITLDAKPAN